MLSHRLHIQDPHNRNPSYLLESVGEAALSASEVVGVFAFASRKGVDLFLGEPSVSRVLRSGKVQLIVGVDAVTNRDTLEHLATRANVKRNLSVRVYWNSTPSLFHPKLCYFRGSKRHTAIVGSGNLTLGGLRDNFEAFSVTTGTPKEMASVNEQLQRFLREQRSAIRHINEEVLDRASRNKVRSMPNGFGDQEPVRESDEGVPESYAGAGRVLLAELPKGGDRWQQANFDKATIESFFQADVDKDWRVSLYEVSPSGSVGEVEVRPCVLTKSRNLRIQLGAHSGEPYPSHGRPIGVFLELKARHFAYLLLLPGERGHDHVHSLLEQRGDGKVLRAEVTLADLMSAWPMCPLGQLVQ